MPDEKSGPEKRPTSPQSSRPALRAANPNSKSPSQPLSAKSVRSTGTKSVAEVKRLPISTQKRLEREQRQAALRQRQQLITGAIIAAALIAIAFVVFQNLPKSTPATPAATSSTAKACAVPPKGTPSATDTAPAVTGNATTNADGLQYIDIVTGCGATVQPSATVTVNYTGWLKDGKMFDSSLKAGGAPFQANLSGGVIPGWQTGIVGMKVGGVRRLIIPPDLGYGASGQGPIPPNATLVFDVALVSIP